MSYTTDVKQEIALHVPEGDEARAELSALIQMTSSLSISSRGLGIVTESGNAAVSRCIYRLLKQRYEVQIEPSVKRRMNLRKNRIYILRAYGNTREILEDLGIYSSRGLKDRPLQRIVTKDSCARAYLAGAFMAQGSVNSPKTSSYHLEIQAANQKHAEFLIELMERFYITARMIERRGHWIVYIKAAERIADFLRCVEADESLLQFEDARITRDLANSVTRLNNVDVANEYKSMQAANRQLADIAVLEEAGQIRFLDDKLQEVITLRKEFPEASLNELAEKIRQRTGNPVSKSGLKHRFVKIHDLAEKAGGTDD
ncbi:MAG: DNA-binding protein WhiA [Solobacterium sp.]|nr:DNA-binding protein WhiA [Solobacterium sp.]MBR3126710.1 DNA-binding protein WhiA [Solobacterium sp.]